MLKLGDRAKDIITGVTGIVTGKTEWLYGCSRLGLQPEKPKDGKPVETQWFDEGQCVLVRKSVVKPSAPILAPTGGPNRHEETK
jgi:hypothetical protein